MRILIIVVLFVLAPSLFGQVQKIHIKRPDTLKCDYAFVAAPGLMNKMYRLSRYRFISPNNLKRKTINNARLKLRLASGKALFINKLYFDSLVNNACIVNKFKLSKIEIKPASDTNYVELSFTYKKMKNWTKE